MIDCSDILGEYSDYRDGLLEPSRAGLVEAHLRACAACARYAEVVEKGLEQLRFLPELTPSADFLPRLQSRIHSLEEKDPWTISEGSRSRAVVIAAIAVLLAAAAWIPVLRDSPGAGTATAAANVAQDLPTYSVFRVSSPVISTPRGHHPNPAWLPENDGLAPSFAQASDIRVTR